MNKMQKIQEEVFQLLMKYHKESDDFLFTLRQTNRSQRLDMEN